MKKYIIFFGVTLILLVTSCASSGLNSVSPENAAIQYYEYIIENNSKCIEMQLIRHVGGTQQMREIMNAELDEKIQKNKDNLSAVFFPYNAKLVSVEVIKNEEGQPYTRTECRMLRHAEAVLVKLKLIFADGIEKEQEHLVVKYNETWMIQ